MKECFFFLVMMFCFTKSFAQNEFPDIYKGGSNDGFHLSIVAGQNTTPNIYNGGNNDGFHLNIVFDQNATPNIYTGGINDGFHLTMVVTQNALPNIYVGGANDGFDMKFFAGQNLLPGIYSGGANDGWSASFKSSFVYVFIGNGNWDVPANWQGGLIPPSPLPFGYEIKIDPSGICTLNVVQALSPGSKLTVMTGKILNVPSIQ